MEEYVGNKEEATPVLQIRVMQEKGKETGQPIEESRKRKRNIEDAKTEQEEEEDEEDELISNAAYVVMKDTLEQQSFIGERGFYKLISPFREMIKKR